MNKIKNIQEQANEGCFQISGINNKVTYENIINSLNAANNEAKLRPTKKNKEIETKNKEKDH